MIAAMFAAGCAALLIGYRFYGRFLERQFDVNPDRPTPANTLRDGVDYVPARTPVLFGHHFSSIAGAGPIVGPIAAAAAFGWLPAFAWMMVGAVFVGGTHDFAALMTSIRHRSRSIGEICRLYLSPTTYRLFLGFVWLALVYVLIVFLDLTATMFSPTGGAPAHEAMVDGGAAATAAMIYILLALIFGLVTNKWGLSLKMGSVIFVPLVFVALVASQSLPTVMPSLLGLEPSAVWSIILLAYCFVASVLPVWMLLQPRDYLSSFLLYACVIVGGLGLVISSATGSLPLKSPAFVTVNDPGLGYIFPAMFIVIACGAVSGFHSIVASGTTAKQLQSEAAARPVAYGSMIVEAVLGMIALAAIMWTAGKPQGPPTAVFAHGMGRFAEVFGIPASLGSSFGLLAISTFLLTTLDTCARLARYILEELFGLAGAGWRFVSTVVTLALPFAIIFYKIPDPTTGGCLPAWQAVWPVFGATNQLLAAMALLVVFVWRVHQRKPVNFVAIPMALMIVIAGTGLAQLFKSAICNHQLLIAGLSGVLLVMAAALLIDTAFSWKRITTARDPAV